MNYCLLPDPPRFSLLSPYKATNVTDLSNIAEPDVWVAPGLGGDISLAYPNGEEVDILLVQMISTCLRSA